VNARCAPAAGSDFVLDDYKTVGFNGGLALFDSKSLGHRKILICSMTILTRPADSPTIM